MAYERLKVLRSRTLHNESSTENPDVTATKKLGNLDFLVLSGLSKVFAGCVTYPYQVIRSRLQTYEAHKVYRGTMDAVSQIWAQEGIAGFYKGLGPNLFRVLPSTWVTFLVYENTKLLMPKLAEGA
jgi:solute carrier family 25 folate transporter 32